MLKMSAELMRHTFAALTLLLFLPPAAFACMVDAEDRSQAQVIHPRLGAPAKPPVYLDDCKGVRIQGAAGSVCGTDADGDPKCEDLKPDVVFAGWPKRDSSMQSSFALLLQGAPREREGGSRMDKAKVKVPGMPHGEVLPPQGPMRLMLTSPAVAGRGGTFVLTARGGNAALFSAQIDSGMRVLEVPAQVFKQGSDFSWTLRLGADTYRDQFRITRDVSKLNAELQPIQAATDISEHTRRLWTMMVYDAFGFGYDSERLQLELREGK